MLTRNGFVLDESHDRQTHQKELTVRPLANNDFGFPPPPFKVFRKTTKSICVPQFYAREKIGPPPEDKRVAPTKFQTKITFNGKLRKETSQDIALSKGIEAGNGVLSLPCGYGKTTVALAIALKLGLRTMIVVHKEFLANQWRERIKQFCPGATIGTVQRDKIEVDCDFVIAMLQSLSLKEYEASQFDSIGTVFIDEAHHICAKVFSKSMFKICAKHMYGLSATPERKDGLTRLLHWFVGPTFFSIERENQTQVEVFPTTFSCSFFNEPPPTMRNGKISFVQMITDLVELPERNLMLYNLVKKLLKCDRQILVLSDRRAHCILLKAQFKDDVSGLYMGGMKEADLEESSKKNVIFATFSQAHEGLDIPTLDTVILSTPKSDIKQSVGRILRETTGKKNNPQIYDIRDSWSLLNAMYYKRRKVYVEGGFKFIDSEQVQEDNKNKGFFSKCVITDTLQ